MFSSKPPAARLRGLAARIFLLASSLLPVTALAAAPAVTKIQGSPLTVHVGADNSFQIINSAIPGVGQIYPTQAVGTADMGFFVRTADQFYSPDFRNHSDSTATSFSNNTPFTSTSLSAVTGSGTAADPFTVSAASTLGTSGIAATLKVQYVNGNNYFTKALTLSNSAASQNVKIFLGADIFLAASDRGRPYIETASTSPGGQSGDGCPYADSQKYTILLIPQTPPDAYVARGFSAVWSEIDQGQLSNTVSATECIDNGAALQWNRALPAGASVTVQTAISFGEIPAFAQFDLRSITPASGTAGNSVNVTLGGLGFKTGTTFDLGAGVSVTNLVVVDDKTATATLVIAPSAAAGARDVAGTQSAGGLNARLPNGFTVNAAQGTTYTVTPSAGTNGTISPATVQTVAANATATFTISANAGYTASVGGTCNGTLTGNTYTTQPVIANCTVVASFTPVVVVTPTTTKLVATPNPLPFGNSLGLTATVTSGTATPRAQAAALAAAISGTVTFSVDGAVIGTAPLGANGVASFAANGLSVGTHSLIATYSGDATNATSSSTPVLVTVTAAPAAQAVPAPALSTWAVLAMIAALAVAAHRRHRGA